MDTLVEYPSQFIISLENKHVCGALVVRGDRRGKSGGTTAYYHNVVVHCYLLFCVLV